MRCLKGVLCCALLVAGLIGPVHAEDDDHDGDRLKLEDTPKLTVRGEAELEKPADQLRLTVGVVTEDREAPRALAQNSQHMNRVIEAIEKIGLTDDEYETGRFRVRPQYSRRPRQPDPDWQPQIIGYEVTNTLVIKTTKLDEAGAIIEAANTAGANTVEVNGFELSDPYMFRAEAIAVATRHAIEDAEALATAASLQLVRILAISLDQYTPVRGPEMAMSGARTLGEAAAPPIAPGDVTVRAAVTIMYEIAPAKEEAE